MLKSPFLFADWSADARRSAAYRLERMIRRDGVVSGLRNFVDVAALDDDAGHARAALERMRRAALRMFARRQATVGGWLERLHQGLDAIGVVQGLAQDTAGQQLQDLLARLARELGDSGPRIDLAEWRRWLDGELERASFRDRDVTSPVLFTHLAATALREFDGVILLGCDARQFPGRAGVSLFFNQSVRRQLGLPVRGRRARTGAPSSDRARRRNPTDIRHVAGAGRRRTESREPVLRAAAGVQRDRLWARPAIVPSDLVRAAQVASDASDAPAARVVGAAAPAAVDLVPREVSVSAWGSLVACPYQFYARHMLKLNELDEVREDVEKRDYGEVVHAILRRFHERHAHISGTDRDMLERELAAMSEEDFAPLVARNYLATGWLVRWQALISTYLDWQADREAQGWRFKAGENRASSRSCSKTVRRSRSAVASTGSTGARPVQGREYAVLDYKTQTVDDPAAESARGGRGRAACRVCAAAGARHRCRVCEPRQGQSDSGGAAR